jgi:hypothetical protein
MNNTKALSLKKEKVLVLTKFGILLAVCLIAPLIKQQLITGSLVNAALFTSTALLGIEAGLLISIIPSLAALSLGLLPSALASMVPLIILGNAILVIVFNHFKERNFWQGVFWASFLKFMFLYGSSSLIMSLFLRKEILASAALMMGWPQLITALSGGLIAWFVLGLTKALK